MTYDKLSSRGAIIERASERTGANPGELLVNLVQVRNTAGARPNAAHQAYNNG